MKDDYLWLLGLIIFLFEFFLFCIVGGVSEDNLLVFFWLGWFFEIILFCIVKVVRERDVFGFFVIGFIFCKIGCVGEVEFIGILLGDEYLLSSFLFVCVFLEVFLLFVLLLIVLLDIFLFLCLFWVLVVSGFEEVWKLEVFVCEVLLVLFWFDNNLINVGEIFGKVCWVIVIKFVKFFWFFLFCVVWCKDFVGEGSFFKLIVIILFFDL